MNQVKFLEPLKKAVYDIPKMNVFVGIASIVAIVGNTYTIWNTDQRANERQTEHFKFERIRNAPHLTIKTVITHDYIGVHLRNVGLGPIFVQTLSRKQGDNTQKGFEFPHSSQKKLEELCDHPGKSRAWHGYTMGGGTEEALFACRRKQKWFQDTKEWKNEVLECLGSGGKTAKLVYKDVYDKSDTIEIAFLD